MVNVIKRSGSIVEFDKNKIKVAIQSSMRDSVKGIDEELSNTITNSIENIINNKKIDYISVEELQNMVEDELMKSERKDVAKSYIIYRKYRNINREIEKENNNKILSDEFLSKYKHLPNPMNQLGSFVYYRTYSRWMDLENRRENWWETVKRAVEYNCSLAPTTKEEAEEIYDNIFNLRQFVSGRTFWVGGTKVSEKFACSNFNCAAELIDNIKAFEDLFYLLMIGSGVGIRLLKEDVEKLPYFKVNFNLINEAYHPIEKRKRTDNTSLVFDPDSKSIVKIIVGDSKEGWVKSLSYFLSILTDHSFRDINTIIINYDNVRPKGEKLKTFGGTASGYDSIMNMFNKIAKLLKKYNHDKEKVKLKPIDCLDICTMIGENVVVGGVRRTAMIALIDSDDEECIKAKNNLYINNNGNWSINKDIINRQMANNTIVYQQKPTREKLHWQIEQNRFSGEPGLFNLEAAQKRNPNAKLQNPCAEILLDNKQFCNLTTVNVVSFITEDGKIDKEKLFRSQELSAKMGYRMSLVELELNEWNVNHKRDRLVGCSLSGWQDMVNKTNMNFDDQCNLLRELREVAKNSINEYSKELNDKESVCITCEKPDGSLGLLAGVSPGVHFSHSPYYVRRIRINSNDPLVKVCEELKYPIFPEVGQSIDNCSTKVIEFPCKAPKGKTKGDVSAIEQLEVYKMFMNNYVDHNVSITVHVRDNEWDDVEEWIWNNWDNIVAVSLLSYSDSFYKLMPYEEITEEEYNNRVNNMNAFVPSLLQKYEIGEDLFDVGNDGCESGVCPVR